MERPPLKLPEDDPFKLFDSVTLHNKTKKEMYDELFTLREYDLVWYTFWKAFHGEP